MLPKDTAFSPVVLAVIVASIIDDTVFDLAKFGLDGLLVLIPTADTYSSVTARRRVFRFDALGSQGRSHEYFALARETWPDLLQWPSTGSDWYSTCAQVDGERWPQRP